MADDYKGCLLVRNARLNEVTDKAIVVIIRGSNFYIPKYMIKRVALSMESGIPMQRAYNPLNEGITGWCSISCGFEFWFMVINDFSSIIFMIDPD